MPLAAITTLLKHAKFADIGLDDFVPRPTNASLITLKRTHNGGFVL